MQWKGRRGSANIEDRRRMGGGGAKVGGLGAIAVVVIAMFLGVDPRMLLGMGGQGGSGGSTAELSAQEEAAGKFVSVVLADTEVIWTEEFGNQLKAQYNPPKLVLFRGATSSACGGATESTGPFYCPADRKVYLDTSFFTVMERQLGAKGDFAAAYVVAHEVGHHIQNELGILGKVNQIRAQVSERESNALSVRVELQADCFSGIWAKKAEKSLGTLEPGDIAEAMNAAAKIGDDTLQRNAGRHPMPDSFTHGSSAQRMEWFERGYDSGKITQCDTFSEKNL